MDFSGKVAIVTGEAQGIGKAISNSLLEIGMKLLICDINESTAKSFHDELPSNFKRNVVFKKCDVSSFVELNAAFEMAKSKYGRIDVVINNASMLNKTHWRKMLEVNFVGVIHGIHLAFDYMGRKKGGSGGFVINTASQEGLRGFDLCPIYSGTKHAVVGLTRSFGTPYYFDKTGVTVNAVCPGAIETPLLRIFPGLSADEEKGKDLISTVKIASPDEVAKAVIKLLRDGKNGALLSVDSEGIRYEKEVDSELNVK